MECSMDLMPMGALLMLATQAASGGADRPGELSGKLLVLVQRGDGVLPVTLVHKVSLEVRNDVADRAAVVAERRAAVHAACSLA